MEKTGILLQLSKELDGLETTIRAAEPAAFFRPRDDAKWSPAQNVRHLILAVRPLNLAFSLPQPVFRIFGKPNRPSATYDEVVSRYQEKLRNGAKASWAFIPKVKTGTKEELLEQLIAAYATFTTHVQRMEDRSLDRYFLPHPILGRITLREMVHFTAYHIGHHHRIIRERL